MKHFQDLIKFVIHFKFLMLFFAIKFREFSIYYIRMRMEKKTFFAFPVSSQLKLLRNCTNKIWSAKWVWCPRGQFRETVTAVKWLRQ